jgi:hypothetical protein
MASGSDEPLDGEKRDAGLVERRIDGRHARVGIALGLLPNMGLFCPLDWVRERTRGPRVDPVCVH